MKAIGIVLLVLAGVILAIGVFSAVDEARGGDLRALRLCLQKRSSMYLTPGVTWAGLGVCCLGLDALLKEKGQPAASAGDSTAAPAKAPKAAAPKGEAPVRQAKPATAPAQAGPTATPGQPAAPKQAAPPVKPATRLSSSKSRPAIRPAGDDAPKRNEQDTPGQ